METSIVETVLTDGSKVYDVVFVDGSLKASINCPDQLTALDIQSAMEDANGAEIYKHTGP